MSLSLNNRDSDAAEVVADTFSVRLRGTGLDANGWSVGVGGYYLWYMGRSSPLHGYWGLGPTLSWSRTTMSGW